MALDFTLLTEEQIWGDKKGNGQLDVMKRYGTKVAPTDLTVILGGYMTSGDDRTSENDLTCNSWSVSSDDDEGVRGVDDEGDKFWTRTYSRRISVRPALPPNETSQISPIKKKVLASGVLTTEYGEYPQTVVDEHTFLELERGYNLKSIYPTGKNYTFDSVGLCDYDTSFQAISYPEYELDGKRYIRVLGHPFNGDSKLSTGEQVKKKAAYWVEVQPIEWLMDPSGIMVAKKCLFAGIQFDTKSSYDGDFSKTSMKKYLDTYFAKELEPAVREADKEVIKGLNERLAEISDLEKLKTTVTPARTVERTEQLARITRVRKAKAILSAAAQKAQREGNKKALHKIMEMAKPYAARETAIRNKLRQRRMERCAAKNRG